MSIFSNYKINEELRYRIEELLISNSVFDQRNKILIPKGIKISGSNIAFLDEKFFENDIYLFHQLKELAEKEISQLFIPAFEGVFKRTIERVVIIT